MSQCRIQTSGSATVSSRRWLSLHPKSNLKVTLDSSGNWYTILTCGPLRLRSLGPVQFSTCLRPGPPGRSDGGALPLLAPRCQSAEERGWTKFKKKDRRSVNTIIVEFLNGKRRGCMDARYLWETSFWTSRSSALRMTSIWQNHWQKLKLNLVCQFRVNSNLVLTKRPEDCG